MSKSTTLNLWGENLTKDINYNTYNKNPLHPWFINDKYDQPSDAHHILKMDRKSGNFRPKTPEERATYNNEADGLSGFIGFGGRRTRRQRVTRRRQRNRKSRSRSQRRGSGRTRYSRRR